MPCVAKHLPYMNKIILSGNGLTAEYKVEDYEGVDPDFLIIDSNVSRKTWLNRMLKKLPLEHLPEKLMPMYDVGIQPPKFYFGFILDTKKLNEMARKHDIVTHNDDEVKECPAGYTSDVENLSTWNILEKLGEKMECDLKLKCKPRLGFVRDETVTPIKTVWYFLTSYDSDLWRGSCKPDELSKRVVDYLGLKESLKWYVDYQNYTWDVDELARRMDTYD